MAQWGTKPDLSLITEATWWRERTDSSKLSSDLHMCAIMNTDRHTQIQLKTIGSSLNKVRNLN